MGATPESIDAAHGSADKDCQVWSENWPALQAFLAVQTQWSTGAGGATGLDYTRVRAGLEMAGIEATPELFEKLRTIEYAVLDARATKETESRSK